MYCKHCGKDIDDNSSFCKYCGMAQNNTHTVSNFNSLIDFIVNKPLLSSYLLWLIINLVCLCSGEKEGSHFNILYPKFSLLDEDYFNLYYYQITDFVVYSILIPLTMFFGYHYFKKVTSVKFRIYWAVWFIFNILWYNWSDVGIGFDLYECFFPFTNRYGYPFFCYHAYDLSELVFYTMIIPIAYWGYLYYKDKNSNT